MNIIYFYLSFILIIIIPITAPGQIYKWHDSEGKIHYTDTAQPNAIQLPPQPDSLKKVNPSLKIIPSDIKEQSSIAPKQNTLINTIVIEQPKDQETLQNTAGKVSIIISSTHPLPKDNRWIIVLDGQRRGEPQTQSTLLLEQIERGEHTLQIQQMDIHDKVVASSETITFYVHQSTIQQQTTP